MASNGNFPTIHPRDGSNHTNFTFSDGDLKYSTTTNNRGFITGVAIPETGKWYYEMYILGVGGTQDQVYLGVCDPNKMRPGSNLTSSSRGGAEVSGAGGYTFDNYFGAAYLDGSKQSNDGVGYYRSFPQKVGLAIDRDNNHFKWTYTGSSFSSTYSIPSTGPLYVYVGSGGGSSTASGYFNFGQDSTFGGNISAGGNADGNGIGDFSMAVPAGYLALSTANLSISADIDPDQTNTNPPVKQFGVVTYSGTGSTGNAITGLGFQPDLLWLKHRNASSDYSNALVDSSRGRTKVIYSHSTRQERTSPANKDVASFDSDGFTVDVSEEIGINSGSGTYVAWCWRANGGSTTTNSQGSITSTVQANQAAGFSIVTYAGNDGSWGSGNRDTFGHGLSAAPEFMLFKELNNTDAWTVFHHSVGNGGGSNAAANNLRLDNTDALYTNQSYKSFGETMPTSTLVTVEGNTTNNSGTNHVAYIWHGVEGFSKFGVYVGNGNSDGPFIYTGFRPRFVITKGLSASGWNLRDSARSPFNTINEVTQADTNSAELTSNYDVLFLSSGFKIIATAGDSNTDGNSYVYGAWGDVPFRYNNAF